MTTGRPRGNPETGLNVWRRVGFVLAGAALMVLLAACATAKAGPPIPTAIPPMPSATAVPSRAAVLPTATVAATATPAVSVPSTPTQSAAASPTPTATASPTPQMTATLVPLPLPTRLPAKDWKQWPVVPAVTNRAREIYQQGLAMGNDPHAFSKVGDCQGIKEVWLGVYDQPGLYTLSSDAANLQETIDWFAGSFNRNGFAVMGGYNARAVLQPSVADPAFCQPGESPIECEYRQHHPSIVLVSLEFYYDGRTTQNYEQYMRQILDFYIAHGVVPILATKADNMEGDESLNLTNAKLALEYDLPLWNFWKAVQPLPNHGMDATRPDGFHISVDAWRVRSATSLQALDSVWRGLRDLACSGDLASCYPAQTALPTATPAAPPSHQVLINLAQRDPGAPAQSLGISLLDTQSQALTPLFPAGYQLQAVSPDGAHLLLNQGADLYLATLAGRDSLQLLASDFYPYGGRGAVWLPDGQSILMILDRDGRGIWQMTMENGAVQRLTAKEYTPFELIPSPQGDEIFWADGGCALDDQGRPLPAECQAGNWYRSATAGALPLSLAHMTSPLRSPDGTDLAYTYLTEKNQPALAITANDSAQVWAPLPPGYVMDYDWSPSGHWLAALWQSRSDYSGQLTAQTLFLLNPSTAANSEIPVSLNLDGLVRWSPDGRWLLVSGTEANADGYRVNLRLIPANGGNVTVLDGKMNPPGANFVYISEMQWVPGP